LLQNPKMATEIEQKIMFKLGVGAEAKAAQSKAAAAAVVAEAELAKAEANKQQTGPVLAVEPEADEVEAPQLQAVGE
ncbi:MAG: DNA recombination/repair protein RecA, partial [Rhodoglobus sp.]